MKPCPCDTPGAPEADSASRTALVQGLFIQHSSRLRGFITALTPDLGMVDDVFQETFLTVTVRAESFDASRDFLPWACGIARFKVMEASRRAARAWKALSPDVIDALCASEPEPEADDSQLRHLENCLGRLSPQSRRIVGMFYQQSHKPAEIARHLGWTAESVYVALSRARVALRKCVETRALAEGGSQ